MQLYDNTNKQGLTQEVDRLCSTNDTSYPRVQKTSRINNALEEIVGDLIQEDGMWQFDDTNYSDLPIGTITLVEGQTSYTFNDKFLAIEEVSVKDENGLEHKIIAFDKAELGNQTVEEYFDGSSTTATGFPTHYDKVSDDTIKLYPAPTSTNVTLSAGLRIKFRRTASLFTVASGTTADTQTPGFASPYHILLAYMAAIPYCMAFKKDRVPIYVKKVEELKSKLMKHYGRREEDSRKKASMKFKSFR